MGSVLLRPGDSEVNIFSASQVSCYEPERLADKAWAEIGSEDFACKPWAGVRSGAAGAVRVTPGINVSLECEVTSNISTRAVNRPSRSFTVTGGGPY